MNPSSGENLAPLARSPVSEQLLIPQRPSPGQRVLPTASTPRRFSSLYLSSSVRTGRQSPTSERPDYKSRMHSLSKNPEIVNDFKKHLAVSNEQAYSKEATKALLHTFLYDCIHHIDSQDDSISGTQENEELLTRARGRSFMGYFGSGDTTTTPVHNKNERNQENEYDMIIDCTSRSIDFSLDESTSTYSIQSMDSITENEDTLDAPVMEMRMA
jgi:hypothetical protein